MRAFTENREPARLIILDEPTSSLDAHASRQLLAHIRRMVGRGMSFVFISHLLGEILEGCDRIVVMRDGKIVANDGAMAFDRDRLVAVMGGARREAQSGADTPDHASIGCARPRQASARQCHGLSRSAREGEVIGLAGLAGHGQTDLLRRIFAAAGKRRGPIEVDGAAALVPGDRQNDGVFPLMSIGENISVGSLPGR